MKGAVDLEPVLVALAHGTWFLPVLELGVAGLDRPATRCAVRELGWLA